MMPHRRSKRIIEDKNQRLIASTQNQVQNQKSFTGTLLELTGYHGGKAEISI